MRNDTILAPGQRREPEDEGYEALERLIATRVQHVCEDPSTRLFITDANDLFDLYLSNLPPERRQHYRCNCCRRFIEQYGNLAIIRNQELVPLLWALGSPPPFFAAAVDALYRRVRHADVTSQFFPSASVWGIPVTGVWTHLSANPSGPGLPPISAVKTPQQRMAESKGEFAVLCRALGEYRAGLAEDALRIVEHGAWGPEGVQRAELARGIARWFADLANRWAAAGISRSRNLIVWDAVSRAPVGWAHVRNTILGTLLEDLREGRSYDDCRARWNAKVHPLQYQRPQAAPRAGAYARAEQLVEQLGLLPALSRRAAWYTDIPEEVYLWHPQLVEAAPAPRSRRVTAGPAFGHLQAEPPAVERPLPTQTMSWVKFRREVLSQSIGLEVFFGSSERMAFVGLTTCTEPLAPPILQWDDPERRNPVGVYQYVDGSPPGAWHLPLRSHIPVLGIVPYPCHWHGNWHDQLPETAVLLLQGCWDSQEGSLGLFPEVIRGELREVRSVIEFHNNRTPLQGRGIGTACGLALSAACRSNLLLRATDARDRQNSYLIDRWE